MISIPTTLFIGNNKELTTSFSFYTSSKSIIYPTITTSDNSADYASWEVGNYDYYTGSSPSIDLSSFTDSWVYIKVYTYDPTKITHLYISSCKLIHTLYINYLNGLLYLNASSNPTLYSITMPTNNLEITTGMYISDCTTLQTLDFTGFSNLAGIIFIRGCSSLTTVKLTTSNQLITSFNAENCNLTDTLYLSFLTGLSGDIILDFNYNLDFLILPASSQEVTYFSADNCYNLKLLSAGSMTNMKTYFSVNNANSLYYFSPPVTSNRFSTFRLSGTVLSGIIDLSNMGTFEGDIIMNSNINVTNVTFPTISNNGTLGKFYLHYCNLGSTFEIPFECGYNTDIKLDDNSNLQHVDLPVTSEFWKFSISNCDLELIEWNVKFTSTDNNYCKVVIQGNGMDGALIGLNYKYLYDTGWWYGELWVDSTLNSDAIYYKGKLKYRGWTIYTI